MRIFVTLSVVSFVLFSLLSGCESSSASRPEGVNGGGTCQIVGHLHVMGGIAAQTYFPSSTPQDIQITVNSNPVTVHNALVPGESLSVNDPVVVLMPGSKLVDGHYSAQNATFLDDNVSSSVPLDAQGALAQPVAMLSSGGVITVPADAIGPFSFPNGIDIVWKMGVNSLDVPMDLACTLTIGSNGEVTGSATFTFGGNAAGNARVNFSGSQTSTALVRIQGSGESRSPVELGVIGKARRRHYVIDNARITYIYDGTS